QDVVAGIAVERVASLAAAELVVTHATVQLIVSCAAAQLVVASATNHGVVEGIAGEFQASRTGVGLQDLDLLTGWQGVVVGGIDSVNTRADLLDDPRRGGAVMAWDMVAIVARTALHEVVGAIGDQRVIARAASHQISVGAAFQDVVA